MSSVKRWDHAVRWEGMKISASYMALRGEGKYVLASDYDKLACLVDPGHKLTMDAACGEIAALEAERDELRVQIEVMRELLRKVSPHFAAPPGLGYLHAELDAALAGSKEGE